MYRIGGVSIRVSDPCHQVVVFCDTHYLCLTWIHTHAGICMIPPPILFCGTVDEVPCTGAAGGCQCSCEPNKPETGYNGVFHCQRSTWCLVPGAQCPVSESLSISFSVSVRVSLVCVATSVPTLRSNQCASRIMVAICCY